MKILNRSRLKIATQIILIPSMLSCLLMWSGQYGIDTDPDTPVTVRDFSMQKAIAYEAGTTTTVTTTTTTVTTTTTTTTAVSTTTTATTTAVTTTELIAEPEDQELPVEDEAIEDEEVEIELIEEPEQTEEPEEPAEPPADEHNSEPYIVYKPSTHYVHRSDCRWYSEECYEIDSTKDLEARKCSECNPDIEIINEYVPETPTVADYDRQLLAEIVWHEAGSCWISTYNKAKIAAGVVNRVNDSRFPNSVYAVLTQPGQFTGYYPGCCSPTQDCYDAVDYYFNHTSEFNCDNSWWGDGRQNHFYYQ